ncbi:MAG: hypothetical protein IPM98_13005 [Lewinellaceae bacterium]|nr:hypothetical protein [Lewinellaceae bacterium]
MAPSFIPDLASQALPPALDARFLREEARRRVEQLAGKRWTDFNTHDPGITMLEVLAYAVTDLGLRARLDVADLIAGQEDRPFFTAREVLPSAPVTPADFRRLLTDRLPVRNAWVQPADGAIMGLQQVLLDLEPPADDPLLDLQEVWLRGAVHLPTGSGAYEYYVVFPYWEELPQQWANLQMPLTKADVLDIRVPIDTAKSDYDLYFATIRFEFDSGASVWETGLWIRLPKGIPKLHPDEHPSDNPPNPDELAFRTALQSQINGNITFFQRHRERAKKRQEVLLHAEAVVRQYRNLAEDWTDINTCRIQQIGLRVAELDLQPDADPADVLARICFAANQFITPRPVLHAIETLLAEGRPVDAIFEGPLLENGFPAEADTDRHLRGGAVYTSDLVRLVMQQPEVIGINHLSLDLFVDRIRIATDATNCLRLRNTGEYKPKFSFYDTDIRVFKRGVPVPVEQDKVLTRWLALEEAHRNRSGSTTAGADLAIPAGDNQLDIATFHSIQYDFPATYGLREGEILTTDTPQRRAQGKQLKAYLLFFEQLLANYCAQLDNLQDLFSMRTDAERTYFFSRSMTCRQYRIYTMHFFRKRTRPMQSPGSNSNNSTTATSKGWITPPKTAAPSFSGVTSLLTTCWRVFLNILPITPRGHLRKTGGLSHRISCLINSNSCNACPN